MESISDGQGFGMLEGIDVTVKGSRREMFVVL